MSHRQVGAELDDGVDVGTVHLPHRVAQLVLGNVRDVDRRVAGEALGAHEVEAGLVGEGLEVADGDRVVGADDGDPLDAVAEGAERRGQRVGRLCDADIAAGAGPDALLDLARGLQPAAPDAFGRNAEDQVVRPAGHHPIDGFLERDVDAPDQLVEILVRIDRIVGDVHPRDVVGHPLGRHRVVMRLHDGVGRGRDHTELHPPTPGIDHLVPP